MIAWILTMSLAAGLQADAWFLTARFSPKDAVIHAIPVGKLYRSWVKASVLSEADLPANGGNLRRWYLEDVKPLLDTLSKFEVVVN